MNRKIAALAMTGLVAAPATALAQSSVTISGFLKVGFENLKVGSYTDIGTVAGGREAGSGRKGTHGLADDLSRIIFNVREDLGGGLAAIGQLDIRVKPDDAGPSPAAVSNAQNTANVDNGNSHVGLTSKSWGRIFFGRQDLHYMYSAGDMDVKNSLRADGKALLVFAGAINAKGAAVNGGTAIAGATRTQNVVHYTTPYWDGFTGIVAYSSNPIGNDADIGNAASQSIRRGHAWNLNPSYAATHWKVGYSYWRSKPDAGLAVSVPVPTQWGAADQRGHRLYGDYTFGFGFKIGLAWDNSKLEGNTGLNDGVVLSKRTVWSIPVQYSFMQKHQITGHYTWAKKDTGDIADALGNGGTNANMWAIGYAYDLSKRTSVALTYARINNRSNAGYNLYYTNLGLGASGLMAGEDPRMFGTTLKHSF